MTLSVGCTARPGRSRDNRTGAWRTFKPLFRHDKCTRCGICALICPESAVHENQDGFYDADYNYCKGCGLCAEECPAEDIEMTRDEK